MIIFNHLVEDIGASPEDAQATLDEWEVTPIMQNGKPVGEIMRMGREVHFAMAPDERLKMGRLRLIKSVMADLMDKHQFLVTSIPQDSKHHKLLTIFGFSQTHASRGPDGVLYDHFWMTKESDNDRSTN